MNQGGMAKPALIGGVLLGLLSALPGINALNCCCCAWVIGGGMLASYLYVKSSPVAVTLGSGVALGLLTGAIGGVVDALFAIPLHFLLRSLDINPLKGVQDFIDQIPNMPPQTKEALRALFQQNAQSLFVLVIGGLFSVVIYSVIAMLGGALGVAIFEKRKPGETSGGPPPPPPPPPPPYQTPLDLPPPPPPPSSELG